MCAPGAPSARPRRARAGSHPHPQVVDPADSFRPADAHGRRFVQAQGCVRRGFPLRSGNHTGASAPYIFPPEPGAKPVGSPLKNDGERLFRQCRAVWGRFPALFFRGRPSASSFVSRGGLSAGFSAAGQVPRTTSGGRGSNSGDAAADMRFHTLPHQVSKAVRDMGGVEAIRREAAERSRRQRQERASYAAALR